MRSQYFTWPPASFERGRSTSTAIRRRPEPARARFPATGVPVSRRSLTPTPKPSACLGCSLNAPSSNVFLATFQGGTLDGSVGAAMLSHNYGLDLKHRGGHRLAPLA